MEKYEAFQLEQIQQFLLKLRMDDVFDETLFQAIYAYFKEHMAEYKSSGIFPAGLLPSLLILVDQLSGGSRFWDKKTCTKAEDAEIALQELFVELDEFLENR